VRRAAALFVLALATASLGGCSWSWQLGSLLPDDGDITGSIKPRETSPLSSTIAGEDWRRARAALAVALDIQGDGKTVNWDNPDSGAKGSFTPVGAPFVVKDEICRAFLADLGGKLAPASLQGSACRNGPDDWVIKDVKPFAKAS
jgi:surface antigen